MSLTNRNQPRINMGNEMYIFSSSEFVRSKNIIRQYWPARLVWFNSIKKIIDYTAPPKQQQQTSKIPYQQTFGGMKKKG